MEDFSFGEVWAWGESENVARKITARTNLRIAEKLTVGLEYLTTEVGQATVK